MNAKDEPTQTKYYLLSEKAAEGINDDKQTNKQTNKQIDFFVTYFNSQAHNHRPAFSVEKLHHEEKVI